MTLPREQGASGVCGVPDVGRSEPRASPRGRVLGLVAVVASVASSLASPVAARAQANLSSTPASVTLTVVVPPKVPGGPGAAGADRVLREGGTVQVTSSVGLVDRRPTRVEVSLGAHDPAASPLAGRVLVRDAAGRFVPLAAGAAVTVVERRHPPFGPSAEVVFRVDGTIAHDAEVPVMYRILVGEGERAAAWTFVRSLSLAR